MKMNFEFITYVTNCSE